MRHQVKPNFKTTVWEHVTGTYEMIIVEPILGNPVSITQNDYPKTILWKIQCTLIEWNSVYPFSVLFSFILF